MSNELRNKHARWNKLFSFLRKRNNGRLNLESANLSSANLYSANLSSANLSLANLESANLSLANLYSANLSRAKHIATVSGVGSERRLAVFWIENGQLKIIAGCFNGTKEELLERSEEQHGKDSKHYRGYAAAIAYAEIILAQYLTQPKP